MSYEGVAEIRRCCLGVDLYKRRVRLNKRCKPPGLDLENIPWESLGVHQLVGLGIYQVVGLGVHRPAAFLNLSLRDFSATWHFMTSFFLLELVCRRILATLATGVVVSVACPQ